MNFSHLKSVYLFGRLEECQSFHYASYLYIRFKLAMIRSELKFIRLQVFALVLSVLQYWELVLHVSLLIDGRKCLVCRIIEEGQDDLRNLSCLYWAF